jgi:hypothetical protein
MSSTRLSRRPALRIAALLALPFALFACASGGDAARGESDPSIEQEFSANDKLRKEQREREGQLGNLLKRFDDALEAYQRNLQLGSGADVQQKVESLESLLEQESIRFQAKLLMLLGDEQPRPRWIAAAALGFTGDANVMEALRTRLSDPVARVRESAAFGLGQLSVPYTPVAPLERILFEDESLPVRRSAAWALVRLQQAKAPRAEFVPIWPRLLQGDALRLDEILALHGLRGIALLGEERFAPSAEPYLQHPRALIRQVAIIALARSGRVQDAAAIVPFLSPQESAPNVRLTARKALKHLTGNKVDHGFDLGAWRAEFGLVEGRSETSGSGR